MSTKSGYYRCRNRHGDDPCEYAQAGKNIPIDKVSTITCTDGSLPKCPGKTLSGKPCGGELTFYEQKKPPIKILLSVVVILVLAVLIWFFIKAPDSPDDPGLPSTPSGTTSVPPPANVTPPPEPSGAWWVYEQLETTSNILRTEP